MAAELCALALGCVALAATPSQGRNGTSSCSAGGEEDVSFYFFSCSNRFIRNKQEKWLITMSTDGCSDRTDEEKQQNEKIQRADLMIS